MGFFSKIKDNLNHGGVDIALQAPVTANFQDAGLPVSVTVTNTSSEQQTINCVRSQILATSHEQSFNTGNSNGPQQTTKTVAQSEDNQQFVLQPGESKTVQLNIVLNSGAQAQSQLPENSALSAVAGALGKLQTLSETLDNHNYTYDVKAIADVEGIALDPSKSQSLQILKAGQAGTGFNIST